MIAITGTGWMDAVEFGRLGAGDRVPYRDRALPRDIWRRFPIFSYPVKNFGRFDPASKLTFYAVALALSDAQIGYAPGTALDIGIVATSIEGCLQSNLRYFRDYVESGTPMARGSLFIYTLPTSPAAEAAIHFGLRGPTLYLAGSLPSFRPALEVAAGFVDRREVGSMIVVVTEGETALAIVLAAAPAGAMISPLEPALQIAARCQRFPALLAALQEAASQGNHP